MTAYLWIKLLHILSATILFGTGIGTAFFMLKAYRSGNSEALAVTSRHVVLADSIFTTPAVVIQLATGLWLTQKLGVSFDSSWFVAVIALFVFVGACWIPVVWIQIRIRNLAANGVPRNEYHRLMMAWIGLGIPAFGSMIAIFYLMVAKTGMYG